MLANLYFKYIDGCLGAPLTLTVATIAEVETILDAYLLTRHLAFIKAKENELTEDTSKLFSY